jgi:hypothetical protein
MEIQRQTHPRKTAVKNEHAKILDKRVSLRQPSTSSIDSKQRATAQSHKNSLCNKENKPIDRASLKLSIDKIKKYDSKADLKESSVDLNCFDKHFAAPGSKSVYEEIIHGRKGQQLIKAEHNKCSRESLAPHRSIDKLLIEKSQMVQTLPAKSHAALYASGDGLQVSDRTIVVESNRGVIETATPLLVRQSVKPVILKDFQPQDSEEIPRKINDFLAKGTRPEKISSQHLTHSDYVFVQSGSMTGSVRDSSEGGPEKTSVHIHIRGREVDLNMSNAGHRDTKILLPTTPQKLKYYANESRGIEEIEFTPGGRDLSPAGKLLDDPEALELKFVKIAEEVKKGLAYLVKFKKPDRASDDWPEPSERGISEPEALKAHIKDLELENKEKDIEILNLCVQLQDTSKIMRSLFRRLKSKK